MTRRTRFMLGLTTGEYSALMTALDDAAQTKTGLGRVLLTDIQRRIHLGFYGQPMKETHHAQAHNSDSMPY